MSVSKELNIGRAGEYIALADLLLKGIQCFDTTQGSSYDLIAEHDDRLLKVQVKTTQKIRKQNENSSGVYFFHTKRCGKNGTKRYTLEDIDLYCLVAIDMMKVFYVPPHLVAGKDSVSIRDRNIEYNNAGGARGDIIYLQDLTWENYIANGMA